MTDFVRRHWILTALVAGLLLGVVDLVWIVLLPAPFGDLGNSTATWAVAAFGLGRLLRPGWWRAALAGVALLVVAVEGYYLAAMAILGDDARSLWAPSTILWMALGVVAGSIFGAAGDLSVRAGRWVPALAAAMPGAVLLAEAANAIRRALGGRTDLWEFAALEGVLGLLLLAVLCGTRWRALAGGVALTALGFGAMTLAGLGG